MNYTNSDINILAYLIKSNELSVEKAIEWAYSQYTNDGVEPWIEKLTLAHDKSDVLDVLRDNFQLDEKQSNEAQAGRIAFEYFQKKISLETAISRLLYDVFIDDKINEDKSALYLAEDFFGWHEDPETKALKVAQPILDRYSEKYESAYRKFIA